MSDKPHQLSILDQWASQSGQVSRSTERLSKIEEWIDWEPLYEIGRRIDKTGPQGGQPHKPVRWRFREALAEQGLDEELFVAINRQMEAKGLILKRGTLVNSAIIESADRPLSDDKRKE